MTTINNDQSLIEKVGGIEKAREIVEGAPDKTADTYVADTDTYFSAEFGSYFDHTEFDWLDSDYKSYAEIRANYETVFWLKDLRTAIAKHDEFKVGDLVVFDTTKEFCAKLPDDLMEFRVRKDIDAIVTQGSRWFAVSFVAIRHATPSEIKAGHRLEAERHG